MMGKTTCTTGPGSPEREDPRGAEGLKPESWLAEERGRAGEEKPQDGDAK